MARAGSRWSIKRLAPALLLLAWAACAGAQDVGEEVVRQGRVSDDLYLAGSSVDVLADVAGDVLAVGRRVTLGERIGGDVLAAGGSVVLRGEVNDDARLAGGEVSVIAAVGDDLMAAGGTVTIAAPTRVGGRTWAAGGTVRIAGRLADGLRAAGDRVIISGEVRGDAEIYADKLEVRDGAVIDGTLTYHSANAAHIARGARIGRVVRAPLPAGESETPAGAAAAGLFFLISLTVTGGTLFLLFPRLGWQAATDARRAPGRGLLVGLGGFAATPVAAFILMLTVVGAPLAVLLMATYFVLLAGGFFTGVLWLGALALRGHRGEGPPSRTLGVLVLLGALLVLLLVGWIPLAGPLAWLVVLLLGLGALLRTLFGWGKEKGGPQAAQISSTGGG